MNIKYYCFRCCQAKTNDFLTSIQLIPNRLELYDLVQETHSHVILKSKNRYIAVRTEIFLDNFKVTRV